ncbi:hypothetical protein D3C80_1684370 [compost metagenome]
MSLHVISTTRTCGGSKRRALAYWAAEAQTVTGSLEAMAVTISTQTFCAGFAPLRHTSGRSGQPSQQRALGSNSPGRRKPSAFGVVVSERAMGQPRIGG